MLPNISCRMVEVSITAQCSNTFKAVSATGNVPQLGDWQPTSACALQQSCEGGPWRGSFSVPQGTRLSGKLEMMRALRMMHLCRFVHISTEANRITCR